MDFPEFRLECPRCQSFNHTVTGLKHGVMFRTTSATVFECQDCGKQLFAEAVQSIYDRQLAKHITLYREWKKAQPKAEAKVEAKTPPRLALVPPLPRCAGPDCTNPVRENSKYCSRQCSNRNARLRAKERQ